jgi:DMSO/TMAO reductase YedYZ molybdopterin-dependent catalytic subunit
VSQIDPVGDSRPYGRRAFLGIVAAGAVALVAGGPLQRLASKVVPLDGVGASGWRIYTVSSPMPVFDPERWRLRIDGLVEAPQELTYGDLLRLPQTEAVSTFRCVTGWSVEDVHWRGVLLDDLLKPASSRPEAKALTFYSSEVPYLDSLTIEQSRLPGVMIAHELDGEPLSREHGSPARLVIPQMYGYKGVKWVERIELAEKPVAGFWEQRGWDWDAWVGDSNGL